MIEERDKCLKKLKEFAEGGNIKFPYYVYHHPPVYTCEEAAKLCPTIDCELKCGEMKNLFLVDKKKKFYMISALVDTNVDLKLVASVLGAKGGVRFGNETQLKEVLNLGKTKIFYLVFSIPPS